MARSRTAPGKRTTGSSVGGGPSHGGQTRAGNEPTHRDRPSKPNDDAAGAGLVVIATPIGNAGDITLRALRALEGADVIACEDTRVTARLLAIHGIARPTTPYHEHNARSAGPALIRRLKKGESVALVTDAGTPLVSDPGYRLVRACIAEGIPVTALPGPSAVLTALVLSGLPTDHFLFTGFLPTRQGARRRALAEVAQVRASLVFMESPRRLAAALGDMADVLGAREAAVGRELTKKFEEVSRGNLTELAALYGQAPAPKGEVTVVVAPPAGDGAADGDDLDRQLREALEGASVRDAAAAVAGATGLPRRRVYARALELRREGG